MTYTKESILKLKAHIKEISANQKFLKNQRKTYKIVGDRIMPESEAAWRHQMNRDELRHLYIAYGFMRGKQIEQIEAKSISAYSERQVNQIIEKYGEVICVDTL